MTVKPIFVTTLQEANLDDSCGMKLWFHKYHQGGGITPNAAILPDEMFKATLADMRTIALMDDISQPAIQDMIDEVLAGLSQEDHRNIRAKELLYRRLGWMAAYALFVEPQIRKIYDLIDIPEEAPLYHESLLTKIQTSGRLLRHKQNHQIEHREFVQCSTANARWRESWEWNIRPHLTFMAIRDGLSHNLQWSRIVGLNTGFVANVPNAQLHHPYIYAHFNTQTGVWTHQFKMADEDGGTWRERPVWEYPGSLTDWVLKVGATIADGQFPLSPKIGINNRLCYEWLQQRLHRERTIQAMKITAQDSIHVRTLHFQRRTNECAPMHTTACPYKDLCWSESFMSAALLQTHFQQNLPVLLTQPPSVPAPPTMSERVEQAINAGRAAVVDGAVIPELVNLPY